MKQNRESCRSPVLGLLLAVPLMAGTRGRAEDGAEYRYELYQEEDDRIRVETHSAHFEKAINARLSISAEYVYDGISGASPTGAPPPTGSNQVPLAKLDDIRRAYSVELGIHLGNHTLRPQFAYSKESDYTSYGVSLGDTIELNQKNTTIILGIAHNFDDVEPDFWDSGKRKDSTDILVGVNQLLDQRTVLTANLTLGHSDGYLADPYKRVRFDDYPDPTSTFPEKRPGHKTKEVLFLSLTHFFEPVNGSVESSYRFYHDSFDVLSHTVALAWFQKIGKHVILSPMFRYYYQTAADFYGVRFRGDPQDPTVFPIPDYYSADYRLSEMETFTYGLKAVYKVNDHLHFDAAYKRYDMIGLDNNTADSAYPQANVYTVGGGWWF